MHKELIDLYLTTDKTLDEMGEIFSITGARVGQILRSSMPADDYRKRAVERRKVKTNEYKLDPSWRSLYESENLSISKIADKLDVPPSHIYRAVEANYDREYRDFHSHKTCDGFNRVADKHPMFGRTWGLPPELSGDYEVEYYKGNRVYIHAKMFRQALGCNYSSHFAVHHINNLKYDNDISNLIMVTPSTHMSIHKNDIDLSKFINDKSRIIGLDLLSREIGVSMDNTNVVVFCIADTIPKNITVDDIGVMIK
mgnify:CR=1 FL=1